jgi:FdhE protein
VTSSPWQRRINRAQELARRHSFAAEILVFYVHIATFQEDFYQQLSTAVPAHDDDLQRELGVTALSELTQRFGAFLQLNERNGPNALAILGTELSNVGPAIWSELLARAWSVQVPAQAQEFLAQAFLQPYAELLRLRTRRDMRQVVGSLCPICDRKPTFGVLRQMGEGAARSLVCGFCLNEWNFRRLVCPACGEENDRNLPVYTAAEFDYIRVEGCETCKTYLKTIDLTRNGRAEPIVDELASIPLDLWAREQGYAKMQHNLLGM